MRILIVCSGNSPNFSFKLHHAFVYDQVVSIKRLDANVEFNYFFIKGKGVKGYLSNLKALKNQIRNNKYDLVHAHVASSALLANFQRKVPVITTFHGSDINQFKTRIISFFVELLSSKTIYISEKLKKLKLSNFNKKCSIIPCGVNLELFKPLDRKIERKKFGFKENTKYILFSSSFDNKVKNYTLLKNALTHLSVSSETIKVVELKGYTREEVASLINAVDLCVMTSFSEGSPQFIKEAMACNCPIVSTDVGDVKEVISETDGCHISLYDPKDLANKIYLVMKKKKRTEGRKKMIHYDCNVIARKIMDIYKSISE